MKQTKETTAFEAEVTKYIEMGAKERDNAIKWIMDAYDAKKPADLEKAFKLPKDYLKQKTKEK